mgnify:CR=1 FL=1
MTVQGRRERAGKLLASAVEEGADGEQVGEDLFGSSDLLAGSAPLREGLTDPSRTDSDKLALLDAVFAANVTKTALEVLQDLVKEHWTSSRALVEVTSDLGLDAYIYQALKDGEYADLAQQLIDAVSLISGERELRVQLSDIGEGGAKDRANLARVIFKGRVSPIAERLIIRAAFSTHYGELLQTLRSYASRVAELTGKTLVVAYTATELDEKQYKKLTQLASRRWQIDVLLTTVIDPSLIGGFRLDAGEQSVDTTVRRDFVVARESLTR